MMHHLVTMHHNQIYFIHISILTKYSDHVQLRSHFYNLSLAHNVHTNPDSDPPTDHRVFTVYRPRITFTSDSGATDVLVTHRDSNILTHYTA